jgi:hypothetical protein
MSDGFVEVVRLVKNNKKRRDEEERRRVVADRERRFSVIAKMMLEADQREESSITVDLDMIQNEVELEILRAHVAVAERRTADGLLVGYKINW